MALDLDLRERGKESKMKKGYVLEERLYKTEDGEIVKEGDPRAAYVYRGPGRRIPMEEAIELGLVDESEAKLAESAGDGEGDEGSEEKVDLSGLTRDELNKKAAELGIESPDKIKGGKPKVIEAIEAKLAESAGDGEGDE